MVIMAVLRDKLGYIVGIVLCFNIFILIGLGLVYYRLTGDDIKCSICNESLPLSNSKCCMDYQVIETKISERLDNWKFLKWQQVEMDNYTAVIPSPKPAAHVTISSALTHHPPNQEGLYKIDSWETCCNNAFLGNGVNMWDGCIVVPIEGLYFVYSQVHFMKSIEKSRGDKSLLIHTMNKLSRITRISKCLIKQSDSIPAPGRNGITEKSSYISSTVQLYAGDQLCVLVNQIDFVHCNAASTYFGMYLT